MCRQTDAQKGRQVFVSLVIIHIHSTSPGKMKHLKKRAETHGKESLKGKRTCMHTNSHAPMRSSYIYANAICRPRAQTLDLL